MEEYVGDTEKVVNEVLHNDAAKIFQEEIYRLMPVSDKKKGRHAKNSKSLGKKAENLSVTIRSQGKFGYLYFPDDGRNTKRHVGNQQFFARGVEGKSKEVVERIIGRLVDDFNND